MSLIIDNNMIVSMHYTLTDDNGKVIDSSVDSKPMDYLHGAGFIIPGLEKALTGKAKGDSLMVKVEPVEGYREIIPDLIQVVQKEVFQGAETIEEGMMFDAEAPDGIIHHIVIKKVDGEEITIDSNHPLAGVVLNFDVNIVNIRDATEEEIAHGHVH